MRVVLSTYGGRGDLEPPVALAVRLPVAPTLLRDAVSPEGPVPA